MRIAALITAAGRGTRAGGDPKQWRALAGTPVVLHALAAFTAHPRIALTALVVPPDDLGRVPEGTLAIAGGDSRTASVRAGLEGLADQEITHVLIHDGARPCVSRDVIDRVIDALATSDGAAPAMPVTDTLWQVAEDTVRAPQSRDGLWRAQTPQGFDFASILAAHRSTTSATTDDVTLARMAGMRITVVHGSEENLKITLPEDFARAERQLERNMDIRTGNGFDVHKFGPGDHVTLCGVRVPHSHALVGHSDADVGLHVLTDAIYGALGAGDIGTHFPPSDPQWKGRDSSFFLERAMQLSRERGFRVTHLDVTLICEAPKVGLHAAAMRARVAEICALDEERVSVKATTTETLGFTGRREGIAALATATLVKS